MSEGNEALQILREKMREQRNRKTNDPIGKLVGPSRRVQTGIGAQLLGQDKKNLPQTPKVSGERKGSVLGLGPGFEDALFRIVDDTRNRALISQYANIVDGQLMPNHRGGSSVVDSATDGGGYSFQRLAAPDMASYVGPYDEASAAAKASAEAATGAIDESYDTLTGRLNRGQEQYQSEAEAIAKEQAMARRLAEQQQAGLLASSALEKELGVDAGVAAEVALLKDLQRQANQGADTLSDRMDSAQAAEFQSRLEGVEGSRAAAQSNKAVNLSALLAEIGMGKANAERQYNQDVNQVNQANAQNEERARQAWLKEQELVAKQEEQFKNDQLKLLSEAEVDPWDGDNLADRMENNPNATDFFLTFVDQIGGPRNGRTKARALKELKAAMAASPYRLREDVMRNWIDEYYSGRKIIDEQKFLRLGGDPRFLGR